MVDVYVPKQLVEELTKSKLRIEMKDNAALACSAILERGGKRVFRGKYARVPFEAFGIRRNSTKDTLDWLIKRKYIKSDEQASHPKMPKTKRKNKGPNRSNGYRFANRISEADLVPYTLRPRKVSAAQSETFTIPAPTVDYRGHLTATQKLIAQKMLQFDVDWQVLKHAIRTPGFSIAERVQMEFHAGRMLHKQFYAKSTSTGRLITSLNSCAKALRAALSVNGEQMAESDAGCANPLLLCYLMRKSDKVTYNDLTSFQGWTETGRLYDVIAQDLRTDRETVKEFILSYICGPHDFSLSRLQGTLSRVPPKKLTPELKREIVEQYARLCEIAAWFRRTLPSIDQFLADWKTLKEGHWQAENARRKRIGGQLKGAHAIVSRTLQRMESDLIIEHCCRNIFAKYPDAVLTTIHDSLLVPTSLIKTAETEMRRSFATLGLSPKIKVTPVLKPMFSWPEKKQISRSTKISDISVFSAP